MSDAPRKVVTPVFRMSFPNLFRAKAAEEGGEPKFSLSMLFDEEAQNSKEFKNMKALANAAVKEKWGDKPPANLRSPFRDGSEKSHIDGYEDDLIFVNASTKHQPGVVDGSLQKILDEQQIYGGCYGRATVTAYAYDKKGNRGVAFGLQNIQKVRDGESFSGRTAAEDDFDAVDDDAWGDDDDANNGGF